MRSFQALTQLTTNPETGVLIITAPENEAMMPQVAMRREGNYIAISISFGPIELALRPRYADLVRVLGRLHPVGGLQTTRQVGTGQAYIAMGLMQDSGLVLRPTMVADATGHITFNLFLPAAVKEQLFAWLGVEQVEDDSV